MSSKNSAPIHEPTPFRAPEPPYRAATVRERLSTGRRFIIAFAFVIAAATANAETGSRACAPCHAEIYKKYTQTGMARSSGRVPATTHKESFANAAFESNGAAFKISPTFRLDFTRDTAKATRQLQWFIGSGRLGRSYLFEKDAMLFQAPVSYFAKSKSWNVSPGYEHKPTADFTRRVEPACLQCHASRVQSIAAKPFLEDGISCERCHGDGTAHVAGKGHMVNPAKLNAEARDSVCAQCHLTGAARVATTAGGRAAYQPGRKLSDAVAVFVWSPAPPQQARATGHFEDLANSACKTKAGEKLWCGTCHDPHTEAADYRAKCQTCHTPNTCPNASKGDCVQCHMPKHETGQHLPFTDHSIPRNPAVRKAPETAPVLKPFWGQPTKRELALAHAIASPETALEKLEAAANNNDALLTAQLSFAYDRAGDEAKAEAAAKKAVDLDPSQTAARINLGAYAMKRGDAKSAMSHWLKALAQNPALTAARVNLAVAQFQSGDTKSARATLLAALAYDPDLLAAQPALAPLLAP